MHDWSVFQPLQKAFFRDPMGTYESLLCLQQCGAPRELVSVLMTRLASHLKRVDDADLAVDRLRQYFAVSRSPVALLSLFERDDDALGSLLQVLVTSPRIAELLLSDPDSFDLLRASDGQAHGREVLLDELSGELQTVQSVGRAVVTLRRFVRRETLRVAYGQFVRMMPPFRARQQLSHITDALLESSLRFAIRHVTAEHAAPQRVDGSEPQFCIVALGGLGGQEIGYASPLDLLLVCDQIDRKNQEHVQYQRSIALLLKSLLMSDGDEVLSVQVNVLNQIVDAPVIGGAILGDSRESGDKTDPPDGAMRAAHPMQSDFHSVDEITLRLGRSARTWERLAFVKARVAAGAKDTGEQLLAALQPWIYHNAITRNEIEDIAILRRKLEKRAHQDTVGGEAPLADVPGGRHDLELTVQFLQLLYGSDVPAVRTTGTLDAISAMARSQCLTQQEATILSENHARLCRLEDHLAVLFDRKVSHLPSDSSIQERIAWRLGVRNDDGRGDAERFMRLLDETFQVNRRIINHLMVGPDGESLPETNADDAKKPPAGTVAGAAGASANSPRSMDSETAARLTEALLDPQMDRHELRAAVQATGLPDADAILSDLQSLSEESVSFLSQTRCRHFFAAVAPALLAQIQSTADPKWTLNNMATVADSIGAKATLWELLRSTPATMDLLVRLCGMSPYLTKILVQNPGMVDELIDSLVMDRLPTSERLDTQSSWLCENAENIDPILASFKTAAHLMIGTRDLLRKESVEAIGLALADVSECCVRRVLEFEQRELASRFGDPVNQKGEPVELVAIAMGRLGGREPNYHSALELSFVYASEGETQRRVGGPRSTISNRQFFNVLARNVIDRLQGDGGSRLFSVDAPMAQGPDQALLATSLDSFFRAFRNDAAPVWQRFQLCKTRAMSGTAGSRALLDSRREEYLRRQEPSPRTLFELRRWRDRSVATAGPGNLKRGAGGTVDGDLIAAHFVLSRARDLFSESELVGTNTTQWLARAVEAGHLDASEGNHVIDSYRLLRRVEGKLRLLDSPDRHSLPIVDEETVGEHDSQAREVTLLAALLGYDDSHAASRHCDEARGVIAQSFERLFASY
ncbi:MAG: glutamate-ammonia-ligase adenylyltransferase [Planctomycetota bacterium]